MNQIQISFVETRARRSDPHTSKDAAKNAASARAWAIRQDIQSALKSWGPMTARELVKYTGHEYFSLQRRLSETASIRKTGDSRDGFMVWEWCGDAHS